MSREELLVELAELQAWDAAAASIIKDLHVVVVTESGRTTQRLADLGWKPKRSSIEGLRNLLDYISVQLAALSRPLPKGGSRGCDDIAAERQRQISKEGWTPDHDDEHSDGAMASAALCYIDPELVLRHWPWDRKWWKPSDRRRDLVKAGALIAAEIDRLDRSSSPPLPKGGAETDVRWAVNVLLEKIADGFEKWDTADIWHSDAAAYVRARKHDLALSTPSPVPSSGGLMEATAAQHIGRNGKPAQFTRNGILETCQCRECRTLSARPSSPKGGAETDWKDDPSADERWQAGCDFAMVQLCEALGVDPKSVRWDAATETLDGDVSAVIWNILRAKMGDDWDAPSTPSPVPSSGEDRCKFCDDGGWGPNRDGRNMLGKLWMEVRTELRASPVPSADGGTAA